MSTPGPLLAVDASGCLLVARHTPPVRTPVPVPWGCPALWRALRFGMLLVDSNDCKDVVLAMDPVHLQSIDGLRLHRGNIPIFGVLRR